jgi:hypothetical protein
MVDIVILRSSGGVNGTCLMITLTKSVLQAAKFKERDRLLVKARKGKIIITKAI